ncbi:MAG: hypothetical protein WA996_18960 [Candidatus Promineifilaceae bacterium]
MNRGPKDCKAKTATRRAEKPSIDDDQALLGAFHTEDEFHHLRFLDSGFFSVWAGLGTT